MKLVADINIPYLVGALDKYFKEIVLLPADEINSIVLKDADALLVRTRTLCNKQLLDGSKVKFIGSATIGYDHIDTDYCNEHGIKWVNAPGCNSGAVQQWVAACLLKVSELKNIELKGKTLGIVGVGNVGKKVVEVGLALGMKVLCCDPPRKRLENLSDFVDLGEIISLSDIITFHVPLTRTGIDSTYHLVNEEFIRSLRKDTIILNSSRGEVICTKSLIDGLTNKWIKSVALDVWENEPYISGELLNLVDIATPHIAGYSLEGKVKGTSMVIDSLSKYFNLGIHPWTPNPNPLNERIVYPYPNDLSILIDSTYDIMSDNNNLKNDPSSFEKQRSKYNLRRDFTGYYVTGTDTKVVGMLSKLGFRTSIQ